MPAFEGDGEEVARYAKDHPHDRFRVIKLPVVQNRESRERGWAEAMRIIESFSGRLPILGSNAASTDSLY